MLGLCYYLLRMLSFKRLLTGDENKKKARSLEPLIEKINAEEDALKKLSDNALKEKTAFFRNRLKEGASLDDILPEAYAVSREAARRTLGQRHFDVQLMGGIILHEGGIAEMRTGEGKTLVATLPVYLNAISGHGVHVVTVNDYLARRDGVWMGQVYAALGMSLGIINSDASYLYDPGHEEADKKRDEEGSYKVVDTFLRPCSRREAYHADITYGTNNEFGFDYLRDNLEYEAEQLRQREYNFAIVDEIDSILIDEARTPLIISAPAEESENLYATFASVARDLKDGEHYIVDEKLKAVTLTDKGIERAENILGIDNIYTEKGIKYVHHLDTSVRAKALFNKDKEYVVRDGQIVIVDEFTGRLQPSRRWSEGLHQAIEAKEGVSIQRESRTFASVTFQNYFRMYEKLSGMTGTAQTSAEEFYTVYGLKTISIPTNVPPKRIDQGDLIFQTEKGKFVAVARKVKELNERGQPVLIGTVSIEKNELLSAYLTREGVPHELLNAKNHEREGEIIAQAGELGKVTIATNMAGRGVDIKLGGNPAPVGASEKVKQIGGLFVLGTERHEARRIDNQLRGRSGRQGDPGETQFFVSLEDQLMRVFAADTIKKMMGRFGIPEDEPIENGMITRSLESAQTKIEGFNFDSRKHVLAYDDVLNRQRRAVYARRLKALKGSDEDVDELLNELSSGNTDREAIIAKKKEELGEKAFYIAIRRLFLQAIDTLWVEHLEVMEYTRGSVNLRAYGQRDPLIEYKKEGLRLFNEMQESVDEMLMRLLPSLLSLSARTAVGEDEEKLSTVHENARIIGSGGNSSSKAVEGETQPRSGAQGRKIGRNEVVTITDGTDKKKMKYKKAMPILESGGWRLIE